MKRGLIPLAALVALAQPVLRQEVGDGLQGERLEWGPFDPAAELERDPPEEAAPESVDTVGPVHPVGEVEPLGPTQTVGEVSPFEPEAAPAAPPIEQTLPPPPAGVDLEAPRDLEPEGEGEEEEETEEPGEEAAPPGEEEAAAPPAGAEPGTPQAPELPVDEAERTEQLEQEVEELRSELEELRAAQEADRAALEEERAALEEQAELLGETAGQFDDLVDRGAQLEAARAARAATLADTSAELSRMLYALQEGTTGFGGALARMEARLGAAANEAGATGAAEESQLVAVARERLSAARAALANADLNAARWEVGWAVTLLQRAGSIASSTDPGGLFTQ